MTGSRPPPPPGANRRRHTRYELLAQVQLQIEDDIEVLPIANISAGGIALSLLPGQIPNVAVRAEVTVFLDLTDEMGDGARFTAQAEVVRIDLGGPGRTPVMGLMWTSTDPAVADALAKILAHLRAAGA